MATYTSQYPPSQSSTYVKATTYNSTSFYPYFATDPALSLTGAGANNAWVGADFSITNQRFHIDLGSGFIIKRIYYENYHDSGSVTNMGVKNFTFWGSNTESAFLDLTYGTDTNWTELTCDDNQFDQHTAADTTDPKYVNVTNTTSYRYYAIKIADNWGGTGALGVRRFELQTEDDSSSESSSNSSSSSSTSLSSQSSEGTSSSSSSTSSEIEWSSSSTSSSSSLGTSSSSSIGTSSSSSSSSTSLSSIGTSSSSSSTSLSSISESSSSSSLGTSSSSSSSSLGTSSSSSSSSLGTSSSSSLGTSSSSSSLGTSSSSETSESESSASESSASSSSSSSEGTSSSSDTSESESSASESSVHSSTSSNSSSSSLGSSSSSSSIGTSSSSSSESESSSSVGTSSSSSSNSSSSTSLSSNSSSSSSSSSLGTSSSSSTSSSTTSSTSSTSSTQWNPKDLPNLRLWLDASTIDRTHGSHIATWTDYSGNGFDATQAVTLLQPIVLNDFQNEHPVLYFDNTNTQYYTCSLPLSNPCTIFVVARALYNTSNSYLLSGNDNTNNGMRISCTGKTVSINQDSTLTTPATYNYGSFDIFTGIYNETNSYIYIDGNYKTYGDTATGSSAGMYIGRVYGSTIPCMNGYIAEVVIYNRVLTWAEQLLVENYLSVKWDIQLDYQSSSSSNSSSSSTTSSTSSSQSDVSSNSSSSSSTSSSSQSEEFIVGNIVNRIRYLVNDRTKTRWSDSDILMWVQDGYLRIWKQRPDIRLDSNGNLIIYTKIVSLNQVLYIDVLWQEAIVNYGCYRLLSEDAEDKISQQRANMFKQFFEENLRL